MLLKSCKFRFEHLILWLDLIDLFHFYWRLLLIFSLLLILNGEWVCIFSLSVIERCCPYTLQLYPKLFIHLFQLLNIKLSLFNRQRQWVMIFCLVCHVCKDNISLVRFWWGWFRLLLGLVSPLCLKILQILWCQYINVARYVFLLECLHQQVSKLLKKQLIASLKRNLFNLLHCELSLPL